MKLDPKLGFAWRVNTWKRWDGPTLSEKAVQDAF